MDERPRFDLLEVNKLALVVISDLKDELDEGSQNHPNLILGDELEEGLEDHKSEVVDVGVEESVAAVEGEGVEDPLSALVSVEPATAIAFLPRSPAIPMATDDAKSLEIMAILDDMGVEFNENAPLL
ncbi:hypothetical protein AMTRI_Chr05g59480 [Amborella trichopoda]